MIPAVGYVRFSSQRQNETSVEAQIRDIKAFSALCGYDLLNIYIDRAKSGYSSSTRQGFQDMIQASASREFQAVIVHKYDRFGRDVSDTLYYEKQLKINGVSVISVEERLDDRTPEGLLLKRVIQFMNEFYGQNLAREAMKGLKTVALKGMHTGGKPALGYDTVSAGDPQNPNSKVYVINEHEAQAVRLIFGMYAAGHGYGDIIDRLNNVGYKTKAGRPFGKNSIHDILRNERYSGVYIFNRTAERGPDRKRNSHKYKDDEYIIRIDGAIPAIIDKKTFERVKSRMESNKQRSGSFKAKREYLLSGKLYCGLCSGTMTGETRKVRNNEYGYYICNHRARKKDCTMKSVPQDLIEQAVVDRLNKKIFTTANINSICERIYKSFDEGNDHTERMASLRHEIAMMDKKIQNGTNAILTGFDNPEFRKVVDELTEQRRKKVMELIEVESIPKQRMTTEQIKAEFLKAADLHKLPFLQRRAVIERLVRKIFVYPTPEGDWRIRVIVSPDNPAKEISDYLDIDGSEPPAPRPHGRHAMAPTGKPL